MISNRINASVSNSPTRSTSVLTGPPPARGQAVDQLQPPISSSLTDSIMLPVSMKLLGRGNGFPGGASAVSVKMAARNLLKFGENGSPKAKKEASVAIFDADKKLWMQRKPNGTVEVADGTFTFATMLDGSIRLGEQNNGMNAHAALTGCSKHVLFAGEVEFEKGQLKTYSNGSGTYVPPAALRHQSGFNQAAGFQEVGNPTAILKGEPKEEAISAAEQATAQKLNVLERSGLNRAARIEA